MQPSRTFSVDRFESRDDILRIHHYCMTITTTYNCVIGLYFALLPDISFYLLRARSALCVWGAFGAQAQLAFSALFRLLKTPFHKACPSQA